MTSETITYIGEIGVAGTAMVSPLDLTLLRNGADWNLTGYTNPTLHVWKLVDRATITPAGTLSVQDAANGIVRYVYSGVADPLVAEAGTYEAYVVLDNGSGLPEQSGKFRWTVGAGANL